MSTPVAPSSLSSFDLIGVGAPIMDLVATVPESFLAHTAGDKGGSVNISPDEIARLIALLPAPPALASPIFFPRRTVMPAPPTPFSTPASACCARQASLV